MKRVNFSKGALLILVLGMFRSIIDIFEDTYVTTMIGNITGGDTLRIAIYHVVKFTVCPLVAIFAGKWLKQKYLTVMRLGIAADLFFFIAFANLKNTWLSLIATAALQGCAFMMYYLPLNFVIANWVKSDERHKFISYKSLNSKIMSIALPIILGSMIYNINYTRTISVMTIVVVLQLLTLMFANKVDSSSNFESSNYQLYDFLKKSFSNKNTRRFFGINIGRGIVLVGAQSQLINLLILDKFGNEFELGKITSLIAIMAIISLYIFGRFANEKLYRKILSVLTIIQIVVVISLLLWTNTTTIILIKFCFDCVLSIIGLIIENYSFKLSTSQLNETHKSEFFVYQEIGMNLGRVISWILVIIGCLISTGNVLVIAIFVITIVFAVMSIMVYQSLQ